MKGDGTRIKWQLSQLEMRGKGKIKKLHFIAKRRESGLQGTEDQKFKPLRPYPFSPIT